MCSDPVTALLDALARGDAWAVSDAAGEIKRRADEGYPLPLLPDGIAVQLDTAGV